jgi:nicotinate dehydrogenase subunit A
MPDPITLTVNGRPVAVDADPSTPLLIVLRNDLGLVGARFGCGEGLCGACTVLMDGVPVNSCDTPLWSASGRGVTTVEGLGTRDAPHPVQTAFIEEQAAQCGYCITGMVVATAALLEADPSPDDAAIDAALERHLCRCGVHGRIRAAIHRAAGAMAAERGR